MKLSHEKIVHLSHVIVTALDETSSADFTTSRNEVRLKIVDLLRQQLRHDEEIEQRVRSKIVTQKRSIPEGSQEWDVLFKKYYEEELNKIRSVKS